MWLAQRVLVAVAVVVGVVGCGGHVRQGAHVGQSVRTVRVSVSSSGQQANAGSAAVAISAGGRFVVFDSAASNLVPGDRNGRWDVFVRDLRSRRTVRVSVGPGGRDANGTSLGAAVSPNGRFVVFRSSATNLTRTPDRNGGWDVFLRDRKRGTTSLVSVPPGGGQFARVSRRCCVTVAGLSDNGRYVAFAYVVGDQQPIYVRDRLHKTTNVAVMRPGSWWWFDPFGFSATGRWLVYGPEYTGGGTAVTELHISNLWTHHTTLIPDRQCHLFSTVVVSRDGRYVAFGDLIDGADATNTFRWNRVTGQVVDVHTGTTPVGISTNGRYVAVFTTSWSAASVHMLRIDLATHTDQRIDTTTSGKPPPQGVLRQSSPALALLSADGRFGLYASRDSTIVPNDTNHTADVFLRGPLP